MVKTRSQRRGKSPAVEEARSRRSTATTGPRANFVSPPPPPEGERARQLLLAAEKMTAGQQEMRDAMVELARSMAGPSRPAGAPRSIIRSAEDVGNDFDRPGYTEPTFHTEIDTNSDVYVDSGRYAGERLVPHNSTRNPSRQQSSRRHRDHRPIRLSSDENDNLGRGRRLSRDRHEQQGRSRGNKRSRGHRSSSTSSSESRYKEHRTHLRAGIDHDPLAGTIGSTRISGKFKMPMMENYDGSGDPNDHVQHFKSVMELQGADEAIMCRAFRVTLKKSALEWYNRLRRGSIRSFSELSHKFCVQFVAGQRSSNGVDALFDTKQKKGETLRDYMARFNQVRLKVTGCPDDVTMTAFRRGLRLGDLKKSLALREAHDLKDLYRRARKHMIAEESLREDDFEGSPEGEDSQGENTPRKRGPRKEKGPKKNDRPRRPWQQGPATKLTAPLSQVMVAALNEGYLHKGPKPQKNNGRETEKFCQYHRRNGHATNDCYQLKRDIEQLIQKGCLKKFVAKEDQHQDGRARNEPDEEIPQIDFPLIGTVHGGPAAGGPTNSARKKYARAVMAVGRGHAPKKANNPIMFTDEDLQGVTQPHQDAVVISAPIGKHMVCRLLIDTGSSCEILFWSTLKRMGLTKEMLEPCPGPIRGVTGHTVPILGTVVLPIQLGKAPLQVTVEARFVVIEVESMYNGILGRPLMTEIGGVTSPLHQAMKFQTPRGVGCQRGDQKVSRKCYATTMKNK